MTDNRFRKIGGVLILVTCMFGVSACSLADLVDVEQVSNDSKDVDPTVVQSYTGALGLYNGAIRRAAASFAYYTLYTALITDELQEDRYFVEVDSRQDIRDGRFNLITNLTGKDLFRFLAGQRIAAQQAVGALRRYDRTENTARLSELYTIQAIAEVMLAEGFCSGIPLTNAPFGGVVNYGISDSTTHVLRHAIALFDTSIALLNNQIELQVFAHVGRARALLNLGQYAEANAAVSPLLDRSHSLNDGMYHFFYSPEDSSANLLGRVQDQIDSVFITNREGGNGISWIAPDPIAQDPRLPVAMTQSPDGRPVFKQPVRPLVVNSRFQKLPASSLIEAWLIRAEFQLNTNSGDGRWLETLNSLRRTVNLPDTIDPGTLIERVNLLFRERALWLYFTGHRHGDLRRLIRQYRRQKFSVYPMGLYLGGGARLTVYNDAVTIPVPDNEIELNPRYSGCLTRDP